MNRRPATIRKSDQELAEIERMNARCERLERKARTELLAWIDRMNARCERLAEEL